LIPIALRPDLDLVAGEGLVTVLTGVVGVAALHLDCDDVHRLVVVGASGLSVEADSAHIGMRRWHGYRVEDP
jgi:hypothetical protein